MRGRRRVLFLHPDLGIGGAERLVVDAALALQEQHFPVHIVTAHHDPSHCFPETSDGTLGITVVGDWLPRHIFGRLYAFCAYIRMIYAALYVVCWRRSEFDVVFCDQVSACVLPLRLVPLPIVFYCHFPDKLLTQRKSAAKRAYRVVLDRFEEWTTGLADVILVNSKFTERIFYESFASLGHVPVRVLYPSQHFADLDAHVNVEPDGSGIEIPSARYLFTSINRYERKKDLSLAVRSLDALRGILSDEQFAETHLVMAGGYDERVAENREHYYELVELADQLNVNEHITFLTTISQATKVSLVRRSQCLLYTPSNEHFGIVPLESMYLGTPVIAPASGGPLETIVDGETGFLCKATAQDFANHMSKFIINEDERSIMSSAARRHVTENFGYDKFARQLADVIGSVHR